MRLITKEVWNKLCPKSQGYAIYAQAELKGSELKGITNPYQKGSKKAKEFDDGERIAYLDAQDSEE